MSNFDVKDLLGRTLTAMELEPLVAKLYTDGLSRGDSTGWRSVDQHYTVVPGQWTLITGYPASGKSEWLDALLLNLATNHDWRFSVYSPENFPQSLHVVKLLEKHIGKPFFPGPTERLSEEEMVRGCDWLNTRFGFIEQTQEQPNSIDEILHECWTWCMMDRSKKNGIVIDPWNELEHKRPQGLSETEYISQTLSTVRQFARAYKVHVWIVAHPAKIQKDRDGKRPVPTPADVTGSANWWNKADNAICIHRNQLDDSQIVRVYVQKIRFKNIGRSGFVDLRWDRVTGRYHELPLHVVGDDPKARAAGIDI